MNKTILAAALSLAAMGSASAAGTVLNIEYKGTVGEAITLVLDGATSEDYMAGGMQYQLSGGASFEAFCVEYAQSHSLSGVQSYTVGSFSAPSRASCKACSPPATAA